MKLHNTTPVVSAVALLTLSSVLADDQAGRPIVLVDGGRSAYSIIAACPGPADFLQPCWVAVHGVLSTHCGYKDSLDQDRSPARSPT